MGQKQRDLEPNGKGGRDKSAPPKRKARTVQQIMEADRKRRAQNEARRARAARALAAAPARRRRIVYRNLPIAEAAITARLGRPPVEITPGYIDVVNEQFSKRPFNKLARSVRRFGRPQKAAKQEKKA